MHFAAAKFKGEVSRVSAPMALRRRLRGRELNLFSFMATEINVMESFLRNFAGGTVLVALLCLLGGCTTLVGEERRHLPDPEKEMMVRVRHVAGKKVQLPDGRVMELAGVDVGALTEAQRDTFAKQLGRLVAKPVFVQELGEGRVRLVASGRWHRDEVMEMNCGPPERPPFRKFLDVYPNRQDVAGALISWGLAPAEERGVEAALALPEPEVAKAGRGPVAEFEADEPYGVFLRDMELMAREARLGIFETPTARLVQAINEQDLEKARRALAEGTKVNGDDAPMASLPARRHAGEGMYHPAWHSRRLHPLILACVKKNPEMVKLLLDQGADVDHYDSRTPGLEWNQRAALAFACWQGQVEIIELLLDRGAATAFPDGHSVYDAGIFHLRSLQVLLRRGAPLPKGELEVHVVMVLCENDDGDSLELALKQGADPNGAQHSRTVLMRAAGRSAPRAIEVLLAHGADPNTRDKEGKRAADFAPKGSEAARLLGRK